MDSCLAYISQDWPANRNQPKSLVVLTLFRLAAWLSPRQNLAQRIAFPPIAVFYKFVTEWIFGVEIPIRTEIGRGLRLRHGIGVVINPYARIGSNVMLRHGVTIGNRLDKTDCPVIGDDVELGANAILIGAITIGAGARIGAGAVVVGDVPPGAVAMCRPAEIRPEGH